MAARPLAVRATSTSVVASNALAKLSRSVRHGTQTAAASSIRPVAQQLL
jgi:hypothetical protein